MYFNSLYFFFLLASNNLIIQELFRLNLNEKGVLPPSPSLHHHPNTFHANRDPKRTEVLVNQNGKQFQNMQQPIRTLPEKSNGNTFERTGGTAMRTVAFHFKVTRDHAFLFMRLKLQSAISYDY